jgi:competence protein ComEA
MVTRPTLAVLGAIVAALALCSLGHHARVAREVRAANSAQTARPSNAQRVSRHASGASTGTWIALRDGGPIDLNRATAPDLELLPGIGPSLAQRIVAKREERGGAFASVEELRDVRGIGERMLARIRPWLRVGAPEPNR